MQTNTIEVIRHSLNAAHAALELLDAARLSQPAQPAQPAQASVIESDYVDPPPASRSLSDLLFDELTGSAYALRTVAELCAKFDVTASTLHYALNDMCECYITRTRRSDSAPLVGLASRN